MKLYFKENQMPGPLPHSIALNGTDGKTYTRTDSSTFTDEEIAMAGYTLAPPKPYLVPRNHTVKWHAKSKSWKVYPAFIKPSINKWANIIAQRDALLESAMTKYYYNYEKGIVDQKLNDYIDALNDITKYRLPESVIWPEYIDSEQEDGQ